MEDLSLHILDLAENSISAGATSVEITILEEPSADRLVIEISDNGSGINPDILRTVTDPFYTTRTTRRIGFGLALFQEAAEQADGSLSIKSIPGKQTQIRAEFRYHHIDRKPLGKIADTLIAILLRAPELKLRFTYRVEESSFTFSSEEWIGIRNGRAHIPMQDLVRLKQYLETHTPLNTELSI